MRGSGFAGALGLDCGQLVESPWLQVLSQLFPLQSWAQQLLEPPLPPGQEQPTGSLLAGPLGTPFHPSPSFSYLLSLSSNSDSDPLIWPLHLIPNPLAPQLTAWPRGVGPKALTQSPFRASQYTFAS